MYLAALKQELLYMRSRYLPFQKMYPVKQAQRTISITIWHKEMQNQSGIMFSRVTDIEGLPDTESLVVNKLSKRVQRTFGYTP